MRFRSGVDVIIATPGRLLDHLRRPYGKLAGLKFLVLDEADRMLDMGFLPDIRRILQQLPTKRQTLFFSATMPPPIAALAGQMLRDPVTINLERRAAPAIGITQAVYPVPQHLKATLLLELLKRGEIKDALVFTRTKHRADKVMRFLLQNGLAVERIHGNRSQNQRTEALEGFKSGRYQVLVATDIAARGIDVTALGHVVNFDVPHVPEDYIHRVGRTARAELTGTAFTLLAPDEETLVRGIERAIDKRLPRVTLPEFDYNQRAPEPAAARHSSGPSGHHGPSSRQRGRPESSAATGAWTRPPSRWGTAVIWPASRTGHASPRRSAPGSPPQRPLARHYFQGVSTVTALPDASSAVSFTDLGRVKVTLNVEPSWLVSSPSDALRLSAVPSMPIGFEYSVLPKATTVSFTLLSSPPDRFSTVTVVLRVVTPIGAFSCSAEPCCEQPAAAKLAPSSRTAVATVEDADGRGKRTRVTICVPPESLRVDVSAHLGKTRRVAVRSSEDLLIRPLCGDVKQGGGLDARLLRDPGRGEPDTLELARDLFRNRA